MYEFSYAALFPYHHLLTFYQIIKYMITLDADFADANVCRHILLYKLSHRHGTLNKLTKKSAVLPNIHINDKYITKYTA